MRILVTGMNSAQCIEDYYLRQDLNVVPTQYALIKALRDMGHTVDQRHAIIGEDLKEYDKVIAFIHNPAGFSRYLYNGLWAIYARPDCILSIDDWQADSIFEGITKIDTSEELFRSYLKDMQVIIPDDVEAYAPQLLEAISTIRSMKNDMMIAGFKGGDLSKMLPQYPKHLLKRYYLNPYHLNRTPENSFTGDDNGFSFESMLIEPEQKKMEWVFASLVQGKTRRWLKNLKLAGGWNINYYGGMRGEFKSTRLKEPAMCNEYQLYWGCLVPKYYHAGSGFWRPRVQQVADGNSILLVDDAEGIVYSEAHVGLKVADVEAMDLTQLIDLAKRQKDGLYSNHPLDKNATKRELEEILQ